MNLNFPTCYNLKGYLLITYLRNRDSTVELCEICNSRGALSRFRSATELAVEFI